MELGRIEDKLEKHSELLTHIYGNLQEHMRRTAIAETNIENLARAMGPVQEHVAFIKVVGKLLALLATLAAIYAAIKP
jgi:hypothetical protein